MLDKQRVLTSVARFACSLTESDAIVKKCIFLNIIANALLFPAVYNILIARSCHCIEGVTLMFHFRPGTNDRLIYEGIYARNEYNLPPVFAPSDLIIDVGAHVGFFTSLVLERGTGTVYAIEAHPENYHMAMQHLKTDIEQGRVNLRQGAVWRSDEEERAVLHHSGFKRDFNHPHPDIEINTGGGNVIFNNTGEEVPVIPFDMLLWEATLQETRRVRCLKLDCEGSEWPILLTSKKLHLIDTIVGEYHEIGGNYDSLDPQRLRLSGYEKFTVEELELFLKEQNFTFIHRRATRNDGSPAPRGIFVAKKMD
jgi:FkbM family methyltransferase